MTLISTPFGFDSTAAEVVSGIDLSGKRAVVTGATSGIGVETARALAGAGAEVTLAVRNTDAGERTAADITATTGNTRVRVRHLDLADRSTIAAFTAAWTGPLHILVNNAGIMVTPEEYTPDGRELQFATNHLGHFELTLGLHRALAEADGARVVAVSSSGHLLSPVVFDDLDFRFRPYDPVLGYGQAKTAVVLFAVEGTRRWAGDGITVNSLMPGNISTGLQKHFAPELFAHLVGIRPIPLKTTEQGAATSVLLATSPLLEGVGGRYFEDCGEAAITDTANGWADGVAAYALDPANAERLWDVSLELLA